MKLYYFHLASTSCLCTRMCVCVLYLFACGRRSVLLRRRCDTLCTSGFTHDVMFSYHGTYERMDGHGVVWLAGTSGRGRWPDAGRRSLRRNGSLTRWAGLLGRVGRAGRSLSGDWTRLLLGTEYAFRRVLYASCELRNGASSAMYDCLGL